MPEKRKSSQGCGKARPAATHGFKALPFEEDKDPFEDFDDRLDEENLEDLDEYDDYDDCDGVNLGFARELPEPSPRTPPTLPPDTALGEEEEDEEELEHYERLNTTREKDGNAENRKGSECSCYAAENSCNFSCDAGVAAARWRTLSS